MLAGLVFATRTDKFWGVLSGLGSPHHKGTNGAQDSFCCSLVASSVPSISHQNAGTSRGAESASPKRIRVSARGSGAFLEPGAQPIYPEQAIGAGAEGDVTLRVQTDETGRVARSPAIEGAPLLVAASVEALKDFRFRPYLLAENPISAESQTAFRFS